MRKQTYLLFSLLITLFSFYSCNNDNKTENNTESEVNTDTVKMTIQDRISQYAVIKLNYDMSKFNDKQKQVISNLIDAAEIVNDIFWDQTYGNKDSLFAMLKSDDEKKYANINYGPWDRLSDNEPFIDNYSRKPLGANFYPSDIKYLPFIQLSFQDKLSMFTLLRKDENGEDYSIPYHEAYKTQIEEICKHLQIAADLSENTEFKNYLLKRIEGLKTDDFYESDAAWVDMKNNPIDFTIGAFDNEEDHFLYIKGAYEASVMVIDTSWTNKFKTYITVIKDLQNELPVSDEYKTQELGANTGIVVCDILYNGGYSNAGPKNIAISRPTDGKVLKQKGSKKLQFKNITEAKFSNILYPISKLLIDSTQLQYIKSESFFENNLFFEICNGIIMNKTIDGKSTVKDALKSNFNIIKNLNNDVLRLFLIRKLNEKGIIQESNINNNFETYLADIFRSVRFGSAHSQGSAAMISFNFYLEKGAIIRNEKGIYKVDFEKMKQANEELAKEVIMIMGDGDIAKAKELIEKYGKVKPDLEKDLLKIRNANIPVDIVFEEGKSTLGL